MSNYYQKEDAKLRICDELKKLGWTIYGYRADQSDSMTDYYCPASWDGIAEKNGYILVVDNHYSAEKQAITKLNKNYIEMDNKDREKINNLSKLTSENGASDGEIKNAQKLIARIKAKYTNEGVEKYETVGYIPAHLGNPNRCMWHLEKDGCLVDKGNKLTVYDILESYIFDIEKMEFTDRYKKVIAGYDENGNRVLKDRELTESELKGINEFKAFILRLERIVNCGNSCGDGTVETEKAYQEQNEAEKMVKKTFTKIKKVVKPVKVDRSFVKVGDYVNYKGSRKTVCYWLVTDVNEERGTFTYKSTGKKYQEVKNYKCYYNMLNKLNEQYDIFELKEVEETITEEKWVRVKTSKKSTKKTESAETKQENNNNSEKTNNEVIEKNSQYIITEDVHTKTNEKIYIVKFEKKFDKDEYVQVAKIIKFIGGYYSKFKKGFIFKENPIEKMKETFGNNKADEQLENIEEPIINKQDDFKESEQKDNKINNEKEAEGVNNINLENLFDNIEIKNENRLNQEDNAVVEKFKNTLADMREKFKLYINMYENNPIQKIDVNSNLEIKEKYINGVEDSIRSFKAEFIENVVNRQTKNLINNLYYYFSKKYNIELKNNNHNTSYYEGRMAEAKENYNYFMSISIDDIVDDIFNQLGGNSLQEKAIQEAKEKIKKACTSYRNEKVVTVKSNTISINDFMYYASSALQWKNYYRLHEEGILKVKNLLKLLNYNNTGIFEVAEDYKTFFKIVSDYNNKFIGQYEINNSYIDSIKTFKNGKLNIKFKSSVQALEFAKKYLGYQE